MFVSASGQSLATRFSRTLLSTRTLSLALGVTFAVTFAVRSPVTFLTDGISLWERDENAQPPD
jgi:hypothetical protein